MKRYSDLQDIDTAITIDIQLGQIGQPEFSVVINGIIFDNQTDIQHTINLLDPVTISVILRNKTYTLEYETAVIINKLSIDNIDIIPQYDYLATYINDHNNTNPTSYLGFNGQWTLTIDRPFYQWLHQASSHGWLLT